MKISIEEKEMNPQESRITFLKLHISGMLDELIKEKNGDVHDSESEITIKKQDLDNLYFQILEHLESRKDFYFPLESDGEKQ